MPENPNEGNPENLEEQQAKAESLEPKGQPLSGDLTKLNERFDKLEQENESLRKENQKLQSGKDKRWNQYEPLMKKLAEKYGDDEIRGLQKDAILEEMIAERIGQSEQPSAAPETDKAASDEAQNIVSLFGLDANDPDVARAIVEKKGDDLTVALREIMVNKATQPPTNPAQDAAAQGSPPVTPDVAQLLADMDELMKGSDMVAIKEKGEELKKAGAPGWS